MTTRQLSNLTWRLVMPFVCYRYCWWMWRYGVLVIFWTDGRNWNTDEFLGNFDTYYNMFCGHLLLLTYMWYCSTQGMGMYSLFERRSLHRCPNWYFGDETILFCVYFFKSHLNITDSMISLRWFFVPSCYPLPTQKHKIYYSWITIHHDEITWCRAFIHYALYSFPLKQFIWIYPWILQTETPAKWNNGLYSWLHSTNSPNVTKQWTNS